jgi:hypothetical protein
VHELFKSIRHPFLFLAAVHEEFLLTRRIFESFNQRFLGIEVYFWSDVFSSPTNVIEKVDLHDVQRFDRAFNFVIFADLFDFKAGLCLDFPSNEGIMLNGFSPVAMGF